MARQIFQATLESLRTLTPTVRELSIRFQEPSAMEFQAGQFAMLHIPGDHPKPVKRAYSIASDDRQPGIIKLIIKLVTDGIASEYVKNLSAGASLELSGPFGKLFFLEPPTEQVLFLCTGAGVSQHYSYLSSRAHIFAQNKYQMLFGVWNEDEIFYQNELDSLKQLLPHFDYEFVLDQPLKSDWSGKVGYVTNFIDQFNYLEVPTTFYLCGNPAMIKGMKALLAEKEFPKERIFAEAFN